MKIGVISLGCPKNLIDTEVMLGKLYHSKFEITKDIDSADIIVINTCSFIESAKEEAINTILQAMQYKHDGKCHKLIVTGCLVQRYSEQLIQELPEVDAFIGTNDFYRIVEVCTTLSDNISRPILLTNPPRYLYDHSTPRIITTYPHSTYLKIAEGCDNRCSYCVISDVRGRYRSRRIESILIEAQKLADTGVRELILVAQDTTRYGTDIYRQVKIAELLKKLCKIDNIRWIRLMYTHPAHYTDELIDTIATEPKICKYLDLPIQHISDDILRLMNRKTTRKQIEHLIHKLRDTIPNLTLRTTFIVGFPGETALHFDELLQFVKDIKFEKLGTFMYSQEEGTLAARFKYQVSKKIKQQRFDKLMKLQRRISYYRNCELIGKQFDVIIDKLSKKKTFLLEGRTQSETIDIDGSVLINEIKIKCNKPSELIGKFVKVKITAAHEYDLIGKIVERL